jgi:hypothetical protein
MHDSSLVTLYSVLAVSEISAIQLAFVLTTVIMIHMLPSSGTHYSFLVQSFVLFKEQELNHNMHETEIYLLQDCLSFLFLFRPIMRYAKQIE